MHAAVSGSDGGSQPARRVERRETHHGNQHGAVERVGDGDARHVVQRFEACDVAPPPFDRRGVPGIDGHIGEVVNIAKVPHAQQFVGPAGQPTRASVRVPAQGGDGAAAREQPVEQRAHDVVSPVEVGRGSDVGKHVDARVTPPIGDGGHGVLVDPEQLHRCGVEHAPNVYRARARG
ncbi:hypothetical protein FGB62_229g08 [Gracilaria domingensis]|nr:hypothetical protein FGB62_229g08 [Gracilaria domingensis]